MTAWIRTRTNSDGSRSFAVLYRRGGRGYRIETAGTFRGWRGGKSSDGALRPAVGIAETEARGRRDLVGGWLAVGLDPREQLEHALAPSCPVQPFSAWAERFIVSRVDVSESTREAYRKRLKRLRASSISDRDPFTLIAQDVRELVGELAATMKPASVAKHIDLVRLVLDYANVEPNPARDRRVKLPRDEREEPQPPPAEHVLAMLECVSPRHLLALVTLEQTGMRVGELDLLWTDVDVPGFRFRLRARETKSRRGKWVPLPPWLMDEIAATCPNEDRTPDRPVFPVASEQALRNTMARACRMAEIPLYSPHDLRHRRITLWHFTGVPVREIQERVGHARASVTLDRYSHVMPVDEIAPEIILEVLRRRIPSPGPLHVMTR